MPLCYIQINSTVIIIIIFLPLCLLLLQIFDRFLPLRSCGLLQLHLPRVPSTQKHWVTQFKSTLPLFLSIYPFDWKWAQTGLCVTEKRTQTEPELWNKSDLTTWGCCMCAFCIFFFSVMGRNLCLCCSTCAENAVPCCSVVLPRFGVEALVQLHRRDHHHAKCAHHLQREDKEGSAKERRKKRIRC